MFLFSSFFVKCIFILAGALVCCYFHVFIFILNTSIFIKKTPPHFLGSLQVQMALRQCGHELAQSVTPTEPFRLLVLLQVNL